MLVVLYCIISRVSADFTNPKPSTRLLTQLIIVLSCLREIGDMGRPKTRRNTGGAKAHPDTEDCYEDAVDREDEDVAVDTADEENCQVYDDQSQDGQSGDGSVVKEKPFQFKKGVQPSRRRVAQQEANAFCIQMTVTSEERGEAGAPPPRYAWTAVLIKDIVQSWLQVEIHEVLITVPGEAILFFGKRSEKQGLTREQAQDLATYFPAQRDWVGKKVAITARVINLFTARGYCHMAKEYRKAKKTANAKSTTGRSVKTTTKPPRTALESLRAPEMLTMLPSDRTTSWVQEQNKRNEGMTRGLFGAIKMGRRGVIEEPMEEEEVEMTLVGATGLTVRMTGTMTRRMPAAILPFRTPPGEDLEVQR